MKLAITFLVVLMSFSNAYATNPISSAEDKSGIKSISAEELVKMQKEIKGFVLIDARGGKYFDGTVIKGAVNLPVTDVTEASLSKAIATKDTPVAFYCTNTACPASSLAAYKAKDQGYSKLYKYEGGIEEWISKKLPTAMIK